MAVSDEMSTLGSSVWCSNALCDPWTTTVSTKSLVCKKFGFQSRFLLFDAKYGCSRASDAESLSNGFQSNSLQTR